MHNSKWISLPVLVLGTMALTYPAAAANVEPARGAPAGVVRAGGGFPIASVVVVRGAGGVDIAWTSGTVAVSQPGAPITGDTRSQTAAVLDRLAKLLASQGFSLGDVVMLRVNLLADPATGKMDFAGMNAAYSQVFGSPAQPNKPARATVQVAGLAAPGALVEIDAQAVRVLP